MKRFFTLVLSLILVLSLAACGTGGQAPASEPESGSSPASEPAPEPEPDPEPDPLPDLQPGRIVGFWDAQQDVAIPTRDVKGTQTELDRWKTAIWDTAITKLDFNNMHQESMELSVEQELEILTAMREAEVRLYEGNPNPSTGGGCWVTAYDGEENLLFHITYLGDFFTVWFPGEEVRYYFDGEGTTLDDLLYSDYGIPAQSPDPDDAEPDPQQVLTVQLESMQEYLEENLDPWDYSDIWRFIGIGEGHIEIATPTPDAVRPVVEAYPGEPFPVEYTYVPFSRGQMNQAREDAERFFEQHPEIELLGIRAQLGVSSGWIINVKEENSALTEFVKNYSIADIYQVVAGVTEFPD